MVIRFHSYEFFGVSPIRSTARPFGHSLSNQCHISNREGASLPEVEWLFYLIIIVNGGITKFIPHFPGAPIGKGVVQYTVLF